MNKVININFQGRILPIEELAYDLLKQYIDSLRTYFVNEEGCDEIINDIECRIAELCDDRLKKGSPCITQEDMNLIITSIGRPADFEAQDGFEQSTASSANKSNDDRQQNAHQNTSDNNNSNFYRNGNSPKRLYRDEQNKVLGGVCSGIANYFVIEPWIVRILWLFLVGLNILIYIILWIAVPSSSVKEIGGVRKRLFRDIDYKLIGGVCAGLAKYFGIQVWIIRILFLIPFIRFVVNFRHIRLFQFWDFPDFPNFLDITFSPGAVFVYIILWLVLPEAKTSADKLEMVGEKVDLNSIKNTIQNEMEGFSKRAQNWGSEFYKKSRTESSQQRTEDRNEGRDERSNAAHENSSNMTYRENKGCLHFIGRAITISIKVFVYFVLAIVGVSLLAALFGIGAAATALYPLKKFVLEDGAQSWSVFGAILLFIWVPIIGIVTAVIRKIGGLKKANVWVRSSFWALWIVGWVMLFYFGSSIGNSFNKHNKPVEQSIALTNPNINYLEVTATPKMKYYEDKWFKISEFVDYGDEDTIFVRNLRIRIVQSPTDSFQVKVVKLSNGKTVAEADDLANKINFDITQQDSIIYLDKGIGINAKDKFRNQHAIMTIAVPIGKRIKISNKGWSQTNIKFNHRGMRTETIDRISSDDDWYNEWDNESFSYERGVTYLMTGTGLEKIGRVDIETTEDDNVEMSDIENQLNELKLERERLEGDLKKSREQKLKELEKIDRALEKKSADKKENKGLTNNTTLLPDLNKVNKVASKLAEMQSVFDRFHY
jgi:phage shock protein PspC (stress-responsive transcriptional regulator)